MKQFNNQLFEFLIVNNIINGFELNENSIRNWGEDYQNILNHYNHYLQNVIDGNSPGPIEKHPYIELYNDECFNLSNNFLILGTFPPSSYFNNLVLDGLPNANIQNNVPVNFFFGNLNNLWDFLFNLQPADITPEILLRNLSHHRISITDVFLYVQRLILKDSSDPNYRNIILNNEVIEIFANQSNINTILFTSGSLSSFYDDNNSTLNGFRWILEEHFNINNELQICGNINGEGQYFIPNQNGIHEASIQQNGGIIWWIKKGEKKIRVINLPSPSRAANIKLPASSFFKKWVNYKAIINNIPIPNENEFGSLMQLYLPNFPNVFFPPFTSQYKREVYQMVLNNTLQTII